MRMDLKTIVVCVVLFSAVAEVLSVRFAVASIYKQSAGAAAAELNSLWSVILYISLWFVIGHYLSCDIYIGSDWPLYK